ncbi:MAG: hypothetical protein JST06_10505 [Bacteroidetes bacterium]|nr:hypothetical protein [Bacteroidota bacterium]MBS1629771.1 hypothetical protein [Bacteroidota bacterium]
MSSRLQDDLLQEFQEQKQWIESQVAGFQPLAVSLRKPAIQRLAGKSLILVGELICWLIFFAALLACIFLHRIYPFTLLFDDNISHSLQQTQAHDLLILRFCCYGLMALCSLSFLLLARSLAGIRQKNSVLNMAGGRIKSLVGQSLARKAAIEVVEQRHFGALQTQTRSQELTDLPNPGYDEPKPLE